MFIFFNFIFYFFTLAKTRVCTEPAYLLGGKSDTTKRVVSREPDFHCMEDAAAKVRLMVQPLHDLRGYM